MINSIELVFLCFYLLFQPHFRGFLKLGQKYYFRSFFGSNENFKIYFRDLLTFSMSVTAQTKQVKKVQFINQTALKQRNEQIL